MKELLHRIRADIDQIDDELVSLMASRFMCIDKIKRIKEEEGIEMLDMHRFDQIVTRCDRKGKIWNLPESLMKDILNIIHQHALNRLKE